MARTKVFRHLFRYDGFWGSCRHALNGVAYLLFYHRNMRIIFLLGLMALLYGIFLGLRGIELAALCITIAFVFIAEIFNTAIELVLDILHRKYHILVKLVKDIAAAVVLIAAANAVAVGYILFVKRIFK